MWGKRKKAGGRKRRSSNRTCPFCETENPSDATSCHQCYYELDVKAMHQSTSHLEDDEDTLWGELIQEVIPGMEEDLSVSVITMDEMTVEVNEYETVGDDEVIIMSQGGPSFAEIMDNAVGNEQDSETAKQALTPASTPVIPKIEVAAEIVNPAPESSSEPPLATVSTPEPASIPAPVPANAPALTPPPVPSIDDLFSTDDDVDDDLEDIIAAAKPVSTPTEDSGLTLVETTPPTEAPPPEVFSSIPAVTNGAKAPLPVQEIVEEATPPTVPVPVITTSPSHDILSSTNIWPWPQSEPWDQRILRREIIETMEAARKGDREAAEAALNRFGPHLGNRFDALHHIGALLHSLGRGEQMKAMILAAQKAYPDDPNVSTAAAALLQS